jgi:phage gp16-like protein
MNIETQKLKLYSIINVGKTQLKLDDETYRAMLAAKTGKNSLKQMDLKELMTVRAHLQKCGFVVKPSAKHGDKPNVPAYKQRQIDKIEAILANAGRPWGYLTNKTRQIDEATGKRDERSMLERITGKQKLEFCTQAELGKVVAALQIDQQRREKREAETAHA